MDWFLYDNGLHHERVKVNWNILYSCFARRYGAFIVNFDHVSRFFLVFVLSSLNQ